MWFKMNSKTILTSIALLFCLWIIYFGVAFFSKSTPNDNELFIPPCAQLVVRINGEHLLKSSLTSVLFEGRDQKVLRQFENSFKKSRKNNKGKTGINFFSDIVLFSTEHTHGTMLVAAFNLINASDFRKNMPHFIGKNQYSNSIENVGFIYTFIEKNSKGKLASPPFKQYFNEFLKPLQHPQKPRFFSKKKSSCLLELVSKEKSTFLHNYLSFSKTRIDLKDNGFHIKSELQWSPQLLSELKNSEKILTHKEEDFHISTSYLPPRLRDSLSVLLNSFALDLPNITNLSLNYRGLTLKNTVGGMSILPDFDLLIGFQETVHLPSLLTKKQITDLTDNKIQKDRVTFNGKQYYFKQVDSKSLYIGTTQTPLFQDNTEILFISTGNLASVLHIEGGGLLFNFLKVIPSFIAGDELFQHTKQFEVMITKGRNKQAYLKGELSFVQEYPALNELLKFVIGMQIIE
jgi:hypothetical protein